MAARTSHPNVHVLLVHLKFDSVEGKNKWKARWSELAGIVYADEPNCLAYEFSDAEASPLEAIIFERYVSKADLDGKHQETLSTFNARVPKVEGAEVNATLTHFIESNIGHMDRYGGPTAKTSHPNVHVLLVSLKFDSAEGKAKWKARWQQLAELVYSTEPNCLAYELSDAEADPTEAIIYERYVSKADLDGKHQETLNAFNARVPNLEGVQVKATLTHFIESNVGHMDR